VWKKTQVVAADGIVHVMVLKDFTGYVAPALVCALLGCDTAYSGNSLPKFRDNLSVPSARAKKSKKIVLKRR
jgi:hypothetical protein